MIWCVEDDTSIREIEIYALTSTGFQAQGFEDGLSFWNSLKQLKEQLPELIILDVMLPGIDGIELLKKIKQTPCLCEIPIIMATAKGAEYDKVQSLDLGADDYLVKPFGMMEMVSRVKAIIRRCKPKENTNILRINDLTLNLDEHILTISNQRINLTFKEFELLKLFLSNPGKVYSRDSLYNKIWGEDFMGESRTVDMHIRTLRSKLGTYGDLIETVRNVGYRMEGKNDR